MYKFFKILGVLVLALFSILVIVVVVIIVKSNTWYSKFLSEIDPEDMVTESSFEEEVFDEKVEEYILSKEDIDFVSFTPREVAHMVYSSLQNLSRDSWIEVGNVYIDPDKAVWQICALTRTKKFKKSDFWVCTDVRKDSMETAQLYITSLNVQGVDLGKIYPKILNSINQAMAEALITANENGFVGRTFENIELRKDGLIVKGAIY